jgi:hypothetical protein
MPPFQDHAEYPRAVFHTRTLSNAPVAIPATATPPAESLKVSHVELRGGASTEVVIFEQLDGSAEYFRVSLSVNEVLVIDRGWEAFGGLRVQTATAAGDVWVTVFYVVP